LLVHPMTDVRARAKREKLTLRIGVKPLALFQYGVVSLLLICSLALYTAQIWFGEKGFMGAFSMFDVGREDSLPTWFSAFNLMIAAILLSFIYLHSRANRTRNRHYWLALCLIFLALSIDEVASIHERMASLQRYTGVKIALIQTHAWLIYGAPLVVIFGAIMFPFLRRLPRTTAARFILAGTIFVGGAMGFEFVGAWMLHHGIAERGDFIYKVRRILEEGCEMYGIAIFNCALAGEIVRRQFALTLGFSGTSKTVKHLEVRN
ncbi:MAG: hypothetical protein ABFS02_12400, partial [Pseudomonadota bacterium]